MSAVCAWCGVPLERGGGEDFRLKPGPRVTDRRNISALLCLTCGASLRGLFLDRSWREHLGLGTRQGAAALLDGEPKRLLRQQNIDALLADSDEQDMYNRDGTDDTRSVLLLRDIRDELALTRTQVLDALRSRPVREEAAHVTD